MNRANVYLASVVPVFAMHLCLPYRSYTPTQPTNDVYRCSAQISRDLPGGKKLTEEWESLTFGTKTQPQALADCQAAVDGYIAQHLSPGFTWTAQNLVAVADAREKAAACLVDWDAKALPQHDFGAPTGVELRWNYPPSNMGSAEFQLVAEDGTVTFAQPAIANASVDLAERFGFSDAGVYTPGTRNAAFSDIFISLGTPFMVGDLEIKKFYVQSVGTAFADASAWPSYRVQSSDVNFFVYVESDGPQGVDSFCVTNAQWIEFRIYQGPPYGEFTFSNTLQMELYGSQLTLKLSLSSPAAPFSAAFKAYQPFVSLVDKTVPTSPVTLAADIALDLDGSADLKRFLWFENFDRAGESFLGEGNPISAPLRKGDRLVSVVAYDSKGSYGAATMTVTVPNVPPVANDDAYETDEDQTLIVPIPGVRGNDHDANGDAFSLILESDPAHGNLMLEDDGSFTYVPDPDYSGVDTFAYKLNDFTAYSNVATVTITIRPVNDAPVAVNDAYSAKEDKKLVVAAPGVLANDTDAEGSALTAALVTGPSHGALALASNGSFTYLPALDYFGPDAFSYRASDGTAWSSAATVSITVVERKPDEEMGDLREIITPLVPGTLNAGQANGLLVKIDLAIAKYQAGQKAVACNLLTALIGQVNGLVAEGTLPAATAQEILARAQNIRGEMGCI